MYMNRIPTQNTYVRFDQNLVLKTFQELLYT